jgi:uncharacterized phosphosugar-binding protein
MPRPPSSAGDVLFVGVSGKSANGELALQARQNGLKVIIVTSVAS